MMTPKELFPRLRVLKICLQILPDKPLPPFLYQGSAWRGILGWELQKLICPFDRQANCEACIINASCPYFQLFEKKSAVPGLFDTPRGYVLYPEQEKAALRLDLTLFGACTDFVPALIEALKRAENRGLGKERIPFSIQGITQHAMECHSQRIDGSEAMQPGMPEPFRLADGLNPNPGRNGRLHMQLRTPLRLRRQGKYLNRFDPVFYLEALARRLEGLDCLFEDGEQLGREKWEALRSCFQAHFTDQTPSWRADLRWRDFARFSNRQKGKVPMGGLIKLFDQETTPRRKASKGKDQEAVLLREIAQGLDMISLRCSTCRGQEIYQDDLFHRIQEKLLELEKDFTTGKAFGPLLKRVRSKLQDMQYPYQAISEEVKRGFESVNWCLEHNLVQQAYTLLRENVVTHFCQLNSLDFSNREKREMVASALRLYQKPKEKWDQKARDNEQEILRVQQSAGQRICKLYHKLSERRNDINHAGIGQPAKSQTLKSDIYELKDQFMALLEKR